MTSDNTPPSLDVPVLPLALGPVPCHRPAGPAPAQGAGPPAHGLWQKRRVLFGPVSMTFPTSAI